MGVNDQTDMDSIYNSVLPAVECSNNNSNNLTLYIKLLIKY